MKEGQARLASKIARYEQLVQDATDMLACKALRIAIDALKVERAASLRPTRH